VMCCVCCSQRSHPWPSEDRPRWETYHW